MKQVLIINFFLLIISGCTSSFEAENRKITDEMDKSLRNELLNAWYPVAIDTVYGGFLSDFTYDWQPDGLQNKMIVTQTRQVWTTSKAAVFLNEDRYREIAKHGFHFLKDKMWDSTYGGFYTLCNREGEAIPSTFGNNKSVYGNAFAIYGLTAYYAMSGDTSALYLATKTFLWLDKHSHDPLHKGYFSRFLWSDSTLVESSPTTNTRDFGRNGWKDQNSSIHLLEAFTELYQVWPDSLLRQRLLEMLQIIRDTITTDKGYLTLFLERDWTPVSFRDSSDAVRQENYFLDHVSFGHDVETAYLMLEASHVLGLERDTKTTTIAKKMVNHALAKGWDDEKGGFYYQGYYFNDPDSISIISEVKTWWVQAEGLNALLLMSGLFPEEEKYYQAFRKQWEYINTYLIDHEHGGWYEEGLDNSPEYAEAPKAKDWKVNYHNMRALMNCLKMLRSEHELLEMR